MTLDLPELKKDPFMDFDLGDIFSMMETDLSAPNFSWLEVEIKTKNERFEPVADDEIQRLIDSQRNPNTRKNTKWAIETFNKWRAARDNVPLLTEMYSESINYWMQRFVLEIRKQDGSKYPLQSLYYIVCGLLSFMRKENIHHMNF